MQAALIKLADKLKAEGREDDAALIYAAAIAVTPPPTPKYENVQQVVPGFYMHTQQY